jgi:hypothetical protein
VIRRFAAALAVLAAALPAAAQSTASPPSNATSQPVEFFPRAAFEMGGDHLSGDDEQFVWDANFRGEVDFVDWGRGRATFLANYQVILGEELKAFDPNQGNYTLALSGSVRLAGMDVSGVFHHESRHLADRFKQTPVDWNMVGARVQRRLTAGALFLDARADVRGVVQKSFVDYSWEADGRLRTDLVARPGVGVLMAIGVQLLGVDGSRDRGTQAGVRAEGGLRFDGRAGAVELFVAAERRVDPSPLAFGTVNWLITGFRLSNR